MILIFSLIFISLQTYMNPGQWDCHFKQVTSKADWLYKSRVGERKSAWWANVRQSHTLSANTWEIIEFFYKLCFSNKDREGHGGILRNLVHKGQDYTRHLTPQMTLDQELSFTMITTWRRDSFWKTLQSSAELHSLLPLVILLCKC